jgi:anti-sigma-K factor RskA
VNTQEYIESGILEAYILGALPEQERAEVEANIAMYPELKQEVAAIEKAMQHFAEATSIEPPAYMQEQIWTALVEEGGAAGNGKPTQPRKVVEFTPEVKSRQNNWARAAVWIALVGSVVANFVLWNQNNNNQAQLATIQGEVDTMVQSQNGLVAKIDMYEKERQMMADPGMKTVVMQTADPAKPMTGMVYWSKDRGDAYVSLVNMPMPPEGKQYQFWVIQDGKPVDMGMIPNDLVFGGMMKMPKGVSGGQAFAISLENEGGNPTPTTVMVVGGITS